MCSINFLYNESSGKVQIKAAIGRMLKKSKHRGPDSSNMYIQGKFGLGVNRLEIIGGAGGQQPISNKEKTIFLLCNGEIFNYQLLKRDLFPEEEFLTTSDCEVIILLYKKFGRRCVDYLEGQYSFIILDLVSREILVARDHYGIHPLFYYLGDEGVVISSTIKSILASAQIDQPELDSFGIAESMFFYGPIPVRTCFRNIRQLPAGHVGLYDLKNKLFKIEDRRRAKKKIEITATNKKKVQYELRRLLEESVEKRLQGSSIPGVYISGGLDSAIIAYYVNKLSRGKMVAFGISFVDLALDEGKYQKIVAAILKIPLIQITVTTEDIIENILNCVRHAETPLIRTGPIPMYLLSEVVKKEKIKFVLCGEGADELFMGYPVFLKDKASFEDKWQDNQKFLGWFRNKGIKSHIQNTFNSVSLSHRSTKSRCLRLKEIDTKLSQYLLTNQGDRMSMAHAVEQRFPYLDSRVTKFAFSLGARDLFDKDGGKAILRRSFDKLLPKSIIARKKQGYLAPDISVMSNIIKTGRFDYYFKRDTVNRVGLFRYHKLDVVIQNILQGKNISENDARMLFFVLTTHLLHEEMLVK